jgi:hypothetical protein
MTYQQKRQRAIEYQRAQLAYDAMTIAPPAAKRLKLRDRVRLSPAQLAARTRPMLALASEYAERSRFMRERHEGEPSYKARLWRLTAHLFTCQARFDLRKFPTPGLRSTAEYVAEFDKLNHLAAT